MNEDRDPGSLRRREAIVGLARSGTVRSQAEFQHLLRKRGIVVAQPTLSRDLRELGLAKTPRGYLAPETSMTQFAPAATREAKLQRTLRSSALSVQAAGSLVVVRAPPAGAHPGARALDEAELAGVAGPTTRGGPRILAAPTPPGARARPRRPPASPHNRGP